MAQESEADLLTHTPLPVMNKRAIWDVKSGLVVSPFNRPLPLEVAEGMPTKSPHYLKARLLEDKFFYLAFYPKFSIAHGALLEVLNVSEDDLRRQIIQGVGGWVLNPETTASWSNLETLMLSVSTTLLNYHDLFSYLPVLAFPKLPENAGYKLAYSTTEDAFKSAKTALKRFIVLSSIVSFTISLWINPFREDAFDRAFSCLSTVAGLSDSTLQHIKDSALCDLSPHFRTGGFVDAMKTRWARLIYRIGRFGTPIWILWGPYERFLGHFAASRTMEDDFRPPTAWIDRARKEATGFEPLTLPQGRSSQPTHQFDLARVATPPPNTEDYQNFSSYDDAPMEPPPMAVEKGSRQRPGEKFEEFKIRMLDRLEREKERDAQTRSSLEGKAKLANSINEGPANLTQKMKCFEWLCDAYRKDYFIRTFIDFPEANWNKYTKYQRVYWPHVNEWDFVYQLPRYPDHVPMADRVAETDGLFEPDEPDYSHEPAKPAPISPERSRAAANALLATIRDNAKEKVLASEYAPKHLTLPKYLRLRHGFDVEALHNESDYLWNHKCPYNVAMGKLGLVSKRLGYPAFTESQHEKSIIDFHNIAVGMVFGPGKPLGSISDLPTNWDLCQNMEVLIRGKLQIDVAIGAPCQDYHFHAMKKTLNAALSENAERLRKVKLYVLRPCPGSMDKSGWFIATTDPTTVLYILRLGFTTMHSIAQKLLEHGTPFRTVEVKNQELVQQPSSQAGQYNMTRGEDWVASEDDYIAYTSARDELLKTYLGRSIRTRGGLIGRLASEIVPDFDVFSGPVRGDEVVGYGSDGAVYVDDKVDESCLDLVVGLNRIPAGKVAVGSTESKIAVGARPVPDIKSKTTTKAARVTLASWWPMSQRWNAAPGRSDHWTPDAEIWYQKRIADFAKGTYETFTGKQWRVKRLGERALYGILEGSRHLAAEAISSWAPAAGPSSSSL